MRKMTSIVVNTMYVEFPTVKVLKTTTNNKHIIIIIILGAGFRGAKDLILVKFNILYCAISYNLDLVRVVSFSYYRILI